MAFNTKAKTVFIDTDSPIIVSEEQLDIVLSPAYYWVKRVTLPVKYLREVKKLLPSLFEDILPEGKYSYTAYRDGDAYMIFAYNDKAILDALSDKGIKSAQIRRIYFAQSEFSDLERPVSLGDDILVQQEGVIVKLPSLFAEGAVPMHLEGHKCSSHNVVLARYAHIADKSSLIWFMSFMVVLILLFGVEWGITNTKTAQIEAENSGVFEKYKLKSTMIQNEAVLQRLEKRYGEQVKIRTISKAVLGLRLGQGEKLERLDILESKVVVEISTASSGRVKALAMQLKRAGLNFKEQFSDSLLRLEMAL